MANQIIENLIFTAGCILIAIVESIALGYEFNIGVFLLTGVPAAVCWMIISYKIAQYIQSRHP